MGSPDPGGGAKTLTDLERDHIVATLERTYWLLGINASTLRSRMRKVGIRRPCSRPPDSSQRQDSTWLGDERDL